MKSKVQWGARIILGLIYFIFGGMGLAMAMGLMTMPQPEGLPEPALAFMGGMMATGYFFPLLKITEVFFGFLLLIGRGAPLALVVLAPVTLHIILYHAFLMPTFSAQFLPLFMGLLHFVAAGAYWNLYKPLFGKDQVGK